MWYVTQAVPFWDDGAIIITHKKDVQVTGKRKAFASLQDACAYAQEVAREQGLCVSMTDRVSEELDKRKHTRS